MAAGRGTDKEAVEQLRTVPLFSGCSARELASLASYLKEVRFQAGRQIVTEGDVGVGLHVILEGGAKVIVGDSFKGSLGPGDFFGEVALLDRGPRMATVIAETPVRTVSLSSWNFKSALKEHPTMAVKMLEEMARRIRLLDPSPHH